MLIAPLSYREDSYITPGKLAGIFFMDIQFGQLNEVAIVSATQTAVAGDYNYQYILNGPFFS